MEQLNNQDITIESLKGLFNLQNVETNEFSIKPNQIDNSAYDVDIKLERKKHICPRCGNYTDLICDYRTRNLIASKIFGHKINIKYNQRRYFCPNCRKRFIETNPIVNKYSKISNLTIKQIKENLKETRSLSSIAKENNMSIVSVINLLNKLKRPNMPKLPEVISIDEFKFSFFTPKYAVSLYDLNSHTINNSFNDRRYNSLLNYFKAYDYQERRKVKLVIMDQWPTYKQIITQLFPNAKIIVDKFHYIRHINWALRDIRIRVMNANKDSIAYKALKQNWKVIQTNPNKFNGKCFNHFQNKFTGKLEFIQDCATHNDEIAEAIHLYHYFLVESYKVNTYDDGCKFLYEWLYKLKNTKLPEFNSLQTLFTNWFNEILNSLIIKNKFNKAYTNGPIEGFNNKIKTLNRVGYGYTNFERFNIRLSLLN